MEQNNLATLADEYLMSIRLTDEQIAQVRSSLEKAKKQRRNMLISKLNANLAVLYRQRNELIEIENHLRTYYSETEVKQAV